MTAQTLPTRHTRRVRGVASVAAALLFGTAACSSSGGGSSSSAGSGATPSVSSRASSTTPASTPSGTSTSTVSAGVDAAFLARIDRECVVGNTYGAAHPFPYPNFDPKKPAAKDLPGVATYFKKSPDVVHQLIALGTPTAGVPAWQQVVAILKDYAANQKQQVTAAAASDAKAFVATLGPAAAIQQRLLVAATRAGLTSAHSCVTYFGS